MKMHPQNKIKYALAAFFGAISLGSLSQVHAATLAFDNFSTYTVDASIDGANGGTGFNGAYFSASPSFGYLHTTRNNGANLSYPGYSSVGGNYLNFAGGYGGPAYMDVQRTLDVAGAFSAYNSGGAIGADNTTLWGSFAYAATNGTPNLMLFGGAANTYFTLPTNLGAASLYVFKINFGTSNADTISFWNNPNLSVFNGSQTPTSTQSGNFSFTNVGYAVNGDTFEARVDNISFGNTVGDVVPVTAVPEPSTVAVALFVVALVAIRNRNRRNNIA